MGGDFDSLMRSIGILNTEMVKSLWSNIEQTVNEDKTLGVGNISAHGITPSQMFEIEDDLGTFNEEIAENANKELKKRIIDLQTELEAIKRQRQMDEDDLAVIVGQENETKGGPMNDYLPTYEESGDEQFDLQITKGGPDPNIVSSANVELQSSNERPMEQSIEFIEFKNRMQDRMDALSEERDLLQASNANINEELQQMKLQMDGLEKEIERVSSSKVKLLINTSKEIDALRKLLTDYVKLANRQREKYNHRQ